MAQRVRGGVFPSGIVALTNAVLGGREIVAPPSRGRLFRPGSIEKLWIFSVVERFLLPHLSVIEALTLRWTSQKCMKLFNGILGVGGEHSCRCRYEEMDRAALEGLRSLPLCWEGVRWDIRARGMNIVDFMSLHACVPAWWWGRVTPPEEGQEEEFVSILETIEIWLRFNADNIRTLNSKDPFCVSIARVCSPLTSSLGQERLRRILRCCMRHLNEPQRQWLIYSVYLSFGEAWWSLQSDRLADFKILFKILEEEFGLLIFGNFISFCETLPGSEEGLGLFQEKADAYFELKRRKLERFASSISLLISRKDHCDIVKGELPLCLLSAPSIDQQIVPREDLGPYLSAQGDLYSPSLDPHAPIIERFRTLTMLYRESREHALPWDMVLAIHGALRSLSQLTLGRMLSPEERLEQLHFQTLCDHLFIRSS